LYLIPFIILARVFKDLLLFGNRGIYIYINIENTLTFIPCSVNLCIFIRVLYNVFTINGSKFSYVVVIYIHKYVIAQPQTIFWFDTKLLHVPCHWLLTFSAIPQTPITCVPSYTYDSMSVKKNIVCNFHLRHTNR